MAQERQIIHMDQDAFFVSVEMKKNPALIDKPVIIGGLSDRGVVASCSYEARKFGIHSAMPSHLAKRLCPHAIFIRGDMDEYSRHSDMVTEVLRQKVPLLEKASIDEHYIDMTGMDRFFGCMQYASELRHHIQKEIGLPISFGLSINKTVSKIATNECKPYGEKEVPKPMVQPFLNPLSIKKIPGIGQVTARKLQEMGIDRIHRLSLMPPDLLYKVLGQNGIGLWQKANGIDESPVVPYREQKSISTQTTFEADSMNMQMMRELLLAMMSDLCFQLRKQHKLTSCITVTIRYANFETVSKQAKIPYTCLDRFLIDKAQELFDQLYNRRMLIRLIGFRLSHLVNGFEQIDLYGRAEESYSLCQAVDHIKKRFGEKAIALAATVPKSEEREKKKEKGGQYVSQCAFGV